MILYNHLAFFNKAGNLINLDKVYSIECIVNRNAKNTAKTIDASIEVITNEYGYVEGFDILQSGRGYTDDVTITLKDKYTNVEYTIDVPSYIKKNSEGGIISVEMPQQVGGFSFPSYIYTGNILFDKVSTGLTEVEQLYIMEEVVNDINDDTDNVTYTAPYSYTDSAGITCNSLTAEWLSEDDPDYEIGLFNILYDEGVDQPYIEDVEKINISLKDDSGDYGKVSSSLIRHVNINSSSTITFNVKLWSEDEGVYDRDLLIYEEIEGNKYIYALLSFKGETEGEDERFRLMLSNFAIELNENEQKLLRDTDIKEEMPDYIVLNQKRKEMLLEYQNIIPYLGSYKGLVNILNFFGYYDCKLKEYWKNIDKTARVSGISKNVSAVDLTSLHMYSRYAKDGNYTVSDTTIKGVEYKKPRFSQDNMDVYDESLTDLPLVSNGKIVGKRIKDVGNLVKPIDISDKTFKINFESASSKLKSIWYKKVMSNVDDYETQYTQIEVPLQLSEKEKDEKNIAMLPKGSWVKDNKIALSYPITKETGDYDDEGLPETEDAFVISEDEAAIKLFSLKKYLQRKFIPIGIELIDIIGEGVYYTRSATKTWSDGVNTLNINREDSFGFTITADSNIVSDLQDYGTTEDKPSLTDTISSLYKKYPNNFGQTHIDFKNDSGSGISFNKDKSIYDFGETGCKIQLDVTDIWTTWDDVDCCWDALKNTNWNELNTREYTDIFWKIKYKGTDKTFFWEDGGVIESYSSITCILPYAGKYDIQCILYDLTATQISKTVEYEVEMPYANFFIFGRNFTNTILTWDDNKDVTWDEMQGEWRHPNYLNNVIWDDLDGITWNDFDYMKYTNQSDPFVKNKTANILSISERDRFIGKKLSISNNIIEFEGCYNKPEMSVGEYLFVRNGESIIPKQISYIKYDSDNNRTYVTFTDMSGISDTTEVLREIGGTVLLNGELSTDTYNELNDGKYLLFRSDGESYRVDNIKAEIVIDEEKGLKSLQLSKNINKVPGEFGNLYERRNVTLTSNEFDSELKTFSPNIELRNNEIIPGFTIINVTSKSINGTYSQRLLVLKDITSGSPVTYKTYSVKELDGDMTFMDNAENTAYWDFDMMQIKLSPYTTREIGNEIELNLNDYPISSDLNYNIFATLGNSCFKNGLSFIKRRDEAALDFIDAIKYYNKLTLTEEVEHQIDICNNMIEQLTDVTKKVEDITIISSELLKTYDINLILDYAIKSGSFSVEIENTGLIDGNTYVKVNDTNNELYQASPLFTASWSSFDEEYAEIRYGTDIFKWENLSEITWNDCTHLNWNMTEYFVAPHCGFVITKVKPNGMIDFGENHHFQFNTLGDCATDESMMIAATKELNESEEEFVQKFNYYYYDNKIHATAKFEGHDALNYIQYSGGVMGEMLDIDDSSFKNTDIYDALKEFKNTKISHTYPIGDWIAWNDPYKYGKNNKYANWNTVARTYYEYSTNPVTELPGWYPALDKDGKEMFFKENSTLSYESHFNTDDAKEKRYDALEDSVKWRYEEYYKQFYDYALHSPFSWDDLIASGKEISVPLFTTLFFVPSNSNVAAKQTSSYQWTLLENDNDVNEVVVSGKDNLIWTFTKPGYYDVLLEVSDINGNKTSAYKKGVVLVS